MLLSTNPLHERVRLEAAWADTQVDDLPDSSVLEDLQRLQACLVPSAEGIAPSTGNRNIRA